MTHKEIIGKIITLYDPSTSETFDPERGQFRSEFEYDPECEEWYIVTGIVCTALEVVLFGIEMRNYEEALDALKIDRWSDKGRPFAIFMNTNFEQLLEKNYANGLRMSPNCLPPFFEYKYEKGLLRYDVFKGTPQEFVELYERED